MTTYKYTREQIVETLQTYIDSCIKQESHEATGNYPYERKYNVSLFLKDERGNWSIHWQGHLLMSGAMWVIGMDSMPSKTQNSLILRQITPL